jgi:hypothetical protein
MKQATGNFGLLIKTNSYAGNFERELTAFCTGQIGECEVGDDYIEKLPINFGNVERVPDEHGCWRPVSLDDKDSNNLIIWFESEPTEMQINFIKERAPKFSEARKNNKRMGEFYQNDPEIEILGVEIIK